MNKINLDVIKQFPNAFSYNKDFQDTDIDKFFNEDMIENCKGIEWLYWSNEQTYCLIGFQDNTVYAIQDEGELTGVCEGLENIPYEMLRILSDSGENGSLEDILQYNQEVMVDLLKYESWWKQNKIELDKQKIYHDENGKLFAHYFEKIE